MYEEKSCSGLLVCGMEGVESYVGDFFVFWGYVKTKLKGDEELGTRKVFVSVYSDLVQSVWRTDGVGSFVGDVSYLDKERN